MKKAKPPKKNKKKKKKPAYGSPVIIGLKEEPVIDQKPCAPVFKPSQAYEKADSPIFWGRQTQVDQFFDQTFDSRLLILYGPRGVGKTSLVQCGLANKFDSTRWEELYIPAEQGLKESMPFILDKKIAAAKENINPDDSQHGTGESNQGETINEKLKKLYEWTFKPLYLVFDASGESL